MRSRHAVRMGEPLHRPAALHRGLTERFALSALLALVPGSLLGWLVCSGQLVGLPPWQLLGLVAVLGALAPLPAVWFARSLTRRIGDLARAVRRLGRGEFEVVMPLRERDELEELATEFNVAARRLSARELEHEREIMDLEREVARLRSDLRSNQSDYQFLEQRTTRA